MKPDPVRHPAIARSLRFLARNWQNPIKVMDLVRVSGLSRRGFLKAFLKHARVHPSDELRGLRMSHAQTLLAGTDYPLPKIARLCGYRSTNTFWVAFHRIHAESPHRYRKASVRFRTSAAPAAPIDIESHPADLPAPRRLISKPLCPISGVQGRERVLRFSSPT